MNLDSKPTCCSCIPAGLAPLWTSWKKFGNRPRLVCLVALDDIVSAAYNGDVCLLRLDEPLSDVHDALMHLLSHSQYRRELDARHDKEDCGKPVSAPDAGNARVARLAVLEIDHAETVGFAEIEHALRRSLLASASFNVLT